MTILCLASDQKDKLYQSVDYLAVNHGGSVKLYGIIQYYLHYNYHR